MTTHTAFKQHVIATSNKALTPEQTMIAAALGLAGETGEIVDTIKKHAYHNVPLDKAAITLELGDLLWYMTRLMIDLDLDLSLEEIMEANITKIQKRYPTGFVEGGGTR